VPDEIQSFYDNNAQREWERLERHRTEFAVTLRAIHEYLPPPPARILDVGGGPGRYSIALAQEGYNVTLFDLSPGLLEFARSKAAEVGADIKEYAQGNALDLSRFPDHSFDAVLLMGPLYHLADLQDRRHAVREAYNALKPSGLIFAAFITRYAGIRWSAKYMPNWVLERAGEREALLATGKNIPPPNAGFVDSYFAHPSEIEALMRQAGFRTVDMLACEGVISMIDEQVNTLTGDAWETWVELNYRLGKDPSVHGAAEHILYIGKAL
jgi:ubiquinone/menaquinone biosynthesis C-methylase UbiE